MKTEVGESIKELSKKAVKAMSSLDALNYSRAFLTLSRALELILIFTIFFNYYMLYRPTK